MSRFLVICPTAPGRFDGVADYACRLGAALSPTGPALLVGLAAGGAPGGDEGVCPPEVARVELASWRELWRRRREPAFADGTPLVQYVPQLYAGRADAVWLLMWLVAARFQGRRVVVTLHEYAVPAARSVRRVAARLILPVVAALVGTVSTHVVVTIDLNRRRLRRWLFWKAGRIALVPVGSNIPAGARREARTASGPPVVCVIFGQPAAMSVPALTAVGRWAADHAEQVRLRWIGRSHGEILDCWSGRCGFQADLIEIIAGRPASDVSAALASADLFIAPLADGVSSRRTTVAAALAHALPIVGTRGPSTDAWLAEFGACALADVGDDAGLVTRLDALAKDAPARRAMARAARALFDNRFAWEAIARAYLQHLAA